MPASRHYPPTAEQWQAQTAGGDRATVKTLTEIRDYFGLDPTVATRNVDARRAFYISVDNCFKEVSDRLSKAEAAEAALSAPPRISPPGDGGTSAEAAKALQDRVQRFLVEPALRTVELQAKLARMRNSTKGYADEVAKLKETNRSLELPDLGNDPEVAFWFKPPTVRPEFDPRLWEAYRAQLPSADTLTSEPILDRQSMADVLKHANAQRIVYLDAACAYWSNWLQDQEASASWGPQPWSVIVDHFSHADVTKLSGIGRQLIRVQHDALAAFSQDYADAEYAKQISDLEMTRDTLGGREFLNDCRAALKAWTDLGSDGDKACEKLVGHTKASELEVFYPASDKTFWFRAFLRATDALSKSAPPVAATQVSEWLTSTNRFPFCLPATDQAVTPWTEPKDLTNIVAGLRKLAPAASFADSEIDADVKAAISKLAVTSDVAAQTRAADVLPYARFAETFIASGQVEIWQLPGKQQPPGGVDGTSFFAVADRNATKIKAGADLAADGGISGRRIATWSARDQNMSFGFLSGSANVTVRTIQEFTPWLEKPLSPLALLATSKRSIPRPSGGNIFVVNVNAGTAQQAVLWEIGIRFVDSKR